MKRPTILLSLTVWLISLAAAYFIGSLKHSEQTTEQPQAEAPTKSSQIKKGAEPEPTVEITEANKLIDYLSGETVELPEALGEISQLSSSEAQSLLTEAFNLPISDPNRRRLIRELLSQIAETDPVAALELAGSIESLRDSERARIAILEVWGRNDPAGAIAWASQALQNEPSRVRNSKLTAIYRGYAENNPQAAFQQALSSESEIRIRILNEVIETQIESGGLQAAKITIDMLNDPDLQASLRRELVDEWAEFDPAAAANYVESLGEDANTNIKSALVSEWAESDPAAAAAWLAGLPDDDPAIARASAAIIQEWTRYDLAASAEWLNSLPPSPELDRAVISYTFRAAEEDPATAMTWAESIESDRRRTWMMERVAATWKEQAPESFNEYLDDSDLTEEQRKKLEEARPSRGGWGRGR